MASWAILELQTVWISARVTAFTLICERCLQLGESYPSVSGTLGLDELRGAVECSHGHRVRVEREGR